MRVLRQSTASQTRLTPMFVDSTDFLTPETALTIANTDVKLSKNGAAVANKNSGGGTHITTGRYALTFDATDSDTVGELAVAINVAGALPVEFQYWVLEEAIFDALYAASAAGYGTAQTGDSFARLGAPAGASHAADIAAVKVDTAATLADTGTDGVVVAAASKTGYALSAAGVQALWDALTSALTTVGSIGKRLADFVTGDAYVRLGAPAGASVSADIAAVKAETVTIQSDADDIQARLPAALTAGGNMKSDALAISGDVTAADRLEALMDATIVGQVNDVGATTTVFAADGFTEATNDHLNGRLITFLTGVLAGQQTSITDYVGATQTLTVVAMTEAPANDDFFVIT